MMKLNRVHRGFSIIEVLVAILVLALGILAVVKLQGVLIQSASDSTQRAFAVSLAQQKIDDLRSFTEIADFLLIDTDQGGQISATDGEFSIQRENYQYSLAWGVEDFFHLTSNDADEPVSELNGVTIPAGARPSFKRVNVFVAWVDETNNPQQVALETIIDSYPPGLTSASGDLSPGGDPPRVSYTPSSDPQVVPIGVGEDTKRETLVPTTSTVDGYARTAFVANTYRPDPDNPTGPGELLRQEEFTTVACKCRFDGASAGSYAVSHAVWDDVVFVENSASYKDVRGEFIEGKVTGCVQDKTKEACDAKPDPLCEICCRDHHDKTELSRKYDPYRSSDGFEADTGNHDHHSIPEDTVTTGQYLESCRMKRVDGIWRAYQDWHLIDLTVMQLSDLFDQDIRDAYASYVAKLVSDYVGAASVGGAAEPLPLAIPSPLPAKEGVPAYDTGEQDIALAVEARAGLVARAVYLDYIDPEHLEELKKLKADENEKDFLLHVPFYEVDVTPVAQWLSDEDFSEDLALRVGPVDEPGSDEDLIAGELDAQKTSARAIAVRGELGLSNSGLVALKQAVDFDASKNPDIWKVSGEVHVCVGCTTGVDPTSCRLPWGPTIENGETVPAYRYEIATTDADCKILETRKCESGTLSGAYQYKDCKVGTPPPATCETTVTGKNRKDDAISVAVYDETDAVVEVPWGCTVTNNQYTCNPVTSVVDAVIKVTRTTIEGGVDGPFVVGTCGSETWDFK